MGKMEKKLLDTLQLLSQKIKLIDGTDYIAVKSKQKTGKGTEKIKESDAVVVS